MGLFSHRHGPVCHPPLGIGLFAECQVCMGHPAGSSGVPQGDPREAPGKPRSLRSHLGTPRPVRTSFYLTDDDFSPFLASGEPKGSRGYPGKPLGGARASGGPREPQGAPGEPQGSRSAAPGEPQGGWPEILEVSHRARPGPHPSLRTSLPIHLKVSNRTATSSSLKALPVILRKPEESSRILRNPQESRGI